MLFPDFMNKPSIDGYDVLDKVGTGGMATVWRAKQISLDRVVALKVLNASSFKSEEHVERFRKEAQAAARLRHPGLAEIYDAGEVDGCVYYVMEYIAGFSVANLIQRKGEVSDKQALRIISGVATVLNAIWEKHQAIHCDIKPDNILIDHDGNTRVTDLGLARFLGSVTAEMDAQYIVGTPNYSSPEQARGVEDLDCRTDIYALGSTLYHMLTGIMPFANTEGETALERHLSDYIADPITLNPDVPIPVAMLLEKMMIKDRTLRYNNWKELMADLDRIQEGSLPSSPWPTTGQSTVLRSSEREAELRKMASSKRPGDLTKRRTPRAQGTRRTGPSSSPRTAPSRATAPSTSTTAAPKRKQSNASPLGATLMTTSVLSLIVVIGYWVIFNQTPQTPTPPAKNSSSEPQIISTRGENDPPPQNASSRERRSSSPTFTEEDMTPSPAPATPEAWSHPSYDEAMVLLRKADKDFQDYLITRDQSKLDSVEPDCRKAIELLESLRAEAPALARIPERVRQANQLIYNSRRSRQ